MTIVSIVGARPQFIKLAMMCRALGGFPTVSSHVIIHTGQHYDADMSDVFFSELDIPRPDFHLGVGSGSHGEQTGEMIKRLERVLVEQRPSWVLLYGDTNSTLAGAVACSKLNLKTVHIEAGLRSFNRSMPEETNRVIADHVSDLLFCPTRAAVHNLEREGLADRALLTGDVMFDAAIHYRSIAEACGGPLAEEWKPKKFGLATVHRAENTDELGRLKAIMSSLDRISREVCPLVFPVHPRTRKSLAAGGLESPNVKLIPPVSYLDMLMLEGRARFILTDSGGVQKESYFAQVPCITLREETEWVETLENGCNVLAGANENLIVQAAADCQAGPWTEVFGDGRAAQLIAKELLKGQ